MSSCTSYPSVLSSLPPGGASMAPNREAAHLSRKRSTPKRSTKKSADGITINRLMKRAANDIMMHSMMSSGIGSSVDGTSPPVLIPRGGRCTVQRAEPSIALERPNFDVHSASTLKRPVRACEGTSEQGGLGKGNALQACGCRIRGFICCLFPGTTQEAQIHGEGDLLAPK